MATCTKPKRKPRKQTSNAMAKLAANVLAGSVLSQDETKGKR